MGWPCWLDEPPYTALPEVTKGAVGLPTDEPYERLYVRLPGDGTLHVDERAVSLAELGQTIHDHMRLHDPEGRRHGIVHLRAHRAVPWQHVRWVLGIAKQSGLRGMMLDVRYVGEGADSGQVAFAADWFPMAFREDGQASEAQDIKVLDVSFSSEGFILDGTVARDKAELAGVARNAVGESGARVAAHFSGPAATRFEHVVHVLEVLGHPHVLWLGAVPPAPSEVLQLHRLPPPPAAK